MKSLNMNDYVTVVKDTDGYFVAEMWFNKRNGSHFMYDRGEVRYATKAEALDIALYWADMEGLEYRD